jgi:hypothetical protein
MQSLPMPPSFPSVANLTSVTIPGSVASLGLQAFYFCTGLASATLSNGVTSIGTSAFAYCPSLTNIALPASVTSLGAGPFWNEWFFGPPAVLWNPQAQASGPAFGVYKDQFGFFITGTTNIPIVVEACTSLAANAWAPLQSCTLTNGSIYFRDPQWASFPARLYRLRSP